MTLIILPGIACGISPMVGNGLGVLQRFSCIGIILVGLRQSSAIQRSSVNVWIY